MRERMLFITDKSPFGMLDQEERRAGSLLELALRKYDVDLVLCGPAAEVSSPPCSPGISLTIYEVCGTGAQSGGRRRRSGDRELRLKVAELCGRAKYDQVLLPHTLFEALIEVIGRDNPDTEIITDIGYGLPGAGSVQNRKAELPLPLRDLHTARIRGRSRRILAKTGKLLAASEYQAYAYKALSFDHARKVHVVPPFIRSRQYITPRQEPRDNMILLLADEQPENGRASAALFFSGIYPLILKEFPETACVYAGRHLHPEALAAAAGFPSVTVVEPGTETSLYIRRARVVVAPLAEGCHDRFRILESWALKTPVVSVSRGTEGLRVEPGGNMLIADNEEGIAQGIMMLLQDPEKSAVMADRAYKTLLQYYDADHLEEGILSVL